MKRVLPPTYFLLALIAMGVLHVVWPAGRYLRFPATLVGLGPLALGVLLNVLADRQFRRHQTTVKPHERSSALVTAFPFSVTRHPMYLGLMLMLAGVAILLGSVSPLAVVLGFAVLLDLRFARVEEMVLAETFGEAWEVYRMRVRRWL